MVMLYPEVNHQLYSTWKGGIQLDDELVHDPRLGNDLYCVEWDVKAYYSIAARREMCVGWRNHSCSVDCWPV